MVRLDEDIESVKEIAGKVDGWLWSDKEGEFLYNAAKMCSGKGVIVEIGSWKGKSTIWLGKGSKAGNDVRIYAVDPHTRGSLEKFRENIKMADINDVVIPMVKTSEDAVKGWDKPVELLWIDGDHRYHMVKLDFKLWFSHLIEGGLIVFHDTVLWRGPRKVAEEFIYKSGCVKDVGFIDSMTFATKVKQNSLKDRLKHRYVLLLKNIFELHCFLYHFFHVRAPKPIRAATNLLLRKAGCDSGLLE